MTARAVVRQAAITRAVRAVYAAGASVVEVRPDGSVLAYKAGDIVVPKVEPPRPSLSKYEDVG